MILASLKARIVAHKRGLSNRIMRLPREKYHIRKSRMNKNNSPTIICNNCVGGVILHDLGLKFNTPTINTLFLSFDDFLYFVEHLKEFSELDVYELKQTEYPFPVGIQEHEGRVVRVGFVHYASFDEGKAAWIKRMKRVNLDNTFVVYESQMISDEELDAFSSIKYPKMVLSLTDKSRERKYSYYKGHQLYKNWFPGKILVYKGFFRTKRYLDDFDYISFLNNGI